FRTYVRFFRQAIPDIRVQVVRSVCEGDLVAIHCLVTGTHTGLGFGGTPTGKSIAFEGMAIARIEDGKLQEGWNCFDGKSMYQQLGLLPPDPLQDIGLAAA
ncbi:ester cyclase, partial [Xanthomonas citri pv. citri]